MGDDVTPVGPSKEAIEAGHHTGVFVGVDETEVSASKQQAGRLITETLLREMASGSEPDSAILGTNACCNLR